MRKLVFRDSVFLPGKADLNRLEYDPDTLLAEQMGEFWDDPLLVRFPNGVKLSVDWDPRITPPAFVVQLNQDPDGWEPFYEKEAASVNELREVVHDALRIVRHRPAIPTPVLEHSWLPGSWSEINELVFDQTKELAAQPERLVASLLVEHGGDFTLSVGWEPPHHPGGQFTIVLRHDPDVFTGLRLDQHRRSELVQRGCKTIPELKRIIGEIADHVWQKEQGSKGH